MSNPKVLVGCPTFSGKEYCLREYADRVKSLSYDNYDVFAFESDHGYFPDNKTVLSHADLSHTDLRNMKLIGHLMKDIFTGALELLLRKVYIGMSRKVRRNTGKDTPMKSIRQ